MRDGNPTKEEAQAIAKKLKAEFGGLDFWTFTAGFLIVVIIIVAILGYF